MRPLSTSVRLGLALAYVALVFLFGLLPMPPGPDVVSYGDKVAHGFMFGGMVLVWVPALRAVWRRAGAPAVLAAAFALSVALGGLLELVQSLFPPRSMELLDFVSDSVGALLAVAAVAAVERWRGAPRRGARSGFPS